MGNFRKAASLFAAAREVCELASGPENLLEAGLLLANILHFEAWMHTKLVRQAPARTPQQALKMTKRALNLRLSLLGPSDQKVAASYGNLAMFAVATGEYEDSLRFSKACLDIRMQDETAQTTNISCTHLYYGWCYAKMNRLVDAEISLLKAIDVLVQHFGEECARKKPHFTWIRTAQASLYLKMGREEDAYEADMQVFETNKAVYHSTSPRVFVSWYKAAWWSWRKGNLEDAQETVEGLCREMEDADHYEGHRARTLNLLSNIYGALGLEGQCQVVRAKAVELARSVEGWNWNYDGDAGFDEL
ncbi:MAG: hypothetical protein Q9175_006103, partial [Cornicularia normoerica]